MATDGWVKIHRQIQNSWLWKEKPFSRAQAWIDLILLANYDDRKIAIGNKVVDVARGSLIISESKLAERWGWSRKKVRNFIDALDSDRMLNKKGTAKYTTLTLENYSLYQDAGQTKEQIRDKMLPKEGPSEDTALTLENKGLHQNQGPTEEQNGASRGYKSTRYEGPSEDTSKTIENKGLSHDAGPTEEQHEANIGANRRANKADIYNNIKKYKKEKKEKNILYNPPYNPPLKKGEIPAVENYTANPELKKAIYDFIEMRKQIKKPMTQLAIELLLKNLNKLSSTDQEKILILEQSILNGWQGIFPLKENRLAESANANKQKSASRPEDDPIIRMGLEMKRKREMMQKNDRADSV